MLATLGVAGVVCCAACTSGDIAQDLKTGQLVGATPKRLQGAEMLGAVLPAFIFAPVMTWLHHAYTIGSDELPAPQARLFASLTEAFFGEGELPWDMVAWGAGIGVVLLVVNAVLQARGAGFRAHVMPVAVGIYLPLSLSVPILIGGLLRQFTTRRGGKATSGPGVLFGSGLIAGEALLGIALALPIGLKWLPLEVPLAGWAANTLSFLALAAVIAVYAAVARRGKGAEASGG
jgi:putative OPT family oligopeptide transporter